MKDLMMPERRGPDGITHQRLEARERNKQQAQLLRGPPRIVSPPEPRRSPESERLEKTPMATPDPQPAAPSQPPDELIELLLRLHDQLDGVRQALDNQTAVLVSLGEHLAKPAPQPVDLGPVLGRIEGLLQQLVDRPAPMPPSPPPETWMERMRVYIRSDEARAAARAGTLSLKMISRAIGQRFDHGHSKHAGQILAEEGYLALAGNGDGRRYIEDPQRTHARAQENHVDR